MQNSSNQNAVGRGYCLDFNPTHKWAGYSNLSIIKSLSNSPAIHDKKGRIIEIYPNRPVDYERYNRCSQLSSNSPAVHDKKGQIIEIYPNRPVDYARYNRCFQLSSNSPAVHGWDNDHAPFIQRDGVYAILSNQNAVYSGYCLDFIPTHKWAGYSNLSIIKSPSRSRLGSERQQSNFRWRSRHCLMEEKMSHTYYKIWLHAIWATHKREKLIHPSIRSQIFDHIRGYCSENEVFIRIINGISDHVHILMSLPPKLAPATAINLIKGESSNWINKENLLKVKFSWQEGYSIFSVSESHVLKVVKYIKGQEKHHRKMTFEEEIEKFLKAYNIGEVTP
ncbi:MAG: IS200/IS605 family transposase [Candidatus Marinimicrobia bacterium]|nr:IS200/IS605 family transposase [bacterium]MCG2717185.1 IS200/IS605 family transposase [Candidatus Neomarinimicrobiota bacterium]